MSYFSGTYRISAILMTLVALLYLVAIVLGGISTLTLVVTAAGLVYLAMVTGLNRGKRWVAWVAFFTTGLGVSFALSQLWTVGGLPAWWSMVALGLNGLAVIGLFAALWRAKPVLAKRSV